MESLLVAFRKSLLVTAGVGLACISGAPGLCPRAVSQDRLQAFKELVPPLRLGEDDFKKGFSKSFRFPRECVPGLSGHDYCEGTIQLSYRPADLAPIRAVINFRYIYYCYACGDDGRDTGPYYYSVDLSGELEPVDDDREGKFPAMKYGQFGGDFRPIIRNNDPKSRVVPESTKALVDIVLMQDIDGIIDRTTYARIRFETDIKTWNPDSKRWDIWPWGFEGMFGPPSSQATDEGEALTLTGCADLLKGGKGQVTAKAKSGGGKYTWSSDSSSVLNVSGSGSSAAVSAQSTGKATVRVEYETKDGEKIEAEKAGSVVELSSVGAVPQIPLIDDNGKELAPVEVPVVQDPGDGDLLTFVVADPGVATVLNLGSVLQIQGIREGSTTAQAQTACGEKTGPVINLEVVRCSRETVQKLRDEQRMIKARIDAGAKHMAELTGDEEFDRAAREGPDDIVDAAKSTAELIVGTMGAAGQVSKAVKVADQVKTADSLWGLANTMNNMATGIAQGDMGKVADATLDAQIQVLELTVASLAKTAYAAGSAAHKLGRDLGTLCGTADRIKDLEDARKQSYRELEDVERRLFDVCKQKSSSGKEPPPPSQSDPKAKPAPAPKPAPPQKTEPPQDQNQEPAEPQGGRPQTEPGGDKPLPPVPPPFQPAGGAVGLPLNCGCSSWNRSAWGGQGTGLASLAEDLRGAGQCSETFQSGLLAGFQNDLKLLSSALKGVSGTRTLPVKEKQAKFTDFLTNTDGLPDRLEKFSREAAFYQSSLEGCGQAGKQAADLIRKGAAQAGAEMIRK
ncbi:MAG TPA: hypothetical protein VE398_21205 [Acidobacteriota bacterium]|nr:hypothetical protein [Acidobacteriota bacterium]